MKNLAMKALLIATAAIAVTAANAQSTQVAFSPNKDRYARGENISVVVLARDASGKRAANVPVFVREYVSSLNFYTDFRFAGFTNYAGEVRVAYRVPTNTSWDNIICYGYSGMYGYYWAGGQRLPIGR